MASPTLKEVLAAFLISHLSNAMLVAVLWWQFQAKQPLCQIHPTGLEGDHSTLPLKLSVG